MENIMKNVVLAITSFVLACGYALAQNGPIQINQDTIAATGLGRSTSGFPYLITQPGSYQLTGNLTVPAGVNGIGISASNVTLDLNGFNITLLGSNTSSAYAIFSIGNPTMNTVRNGTIVGPGSLGPAVYLSTGSSSGMRVENLMVSGFIFSIQVDTNFIVRQNIATGQITGQCPGIMTENVSTALVVVYNTLVAGGSCVVWNNRATNFTNPVIQ